jgi:hypothetical protein
MTAHDNAPIPVETQRFILLAIPSVPHLAAMLDGAGLRCASQAVAANYSHQLICTPRPLGSRMP